MGVAQLPLPPHFSRCLNRPTPMGMMERNGDGKGREVGVEEGDLHIPLLRGTTPVSMHTDLDNNVQNPTD